jgi:hypothetical protein
MERLVVSFDATICGPSTRRATHDAASGLLRAVF